MPRALLALALAAALAPRPALATCWQACALAVVTPGQTAPDFEGAHRWVEGSPQRFVIGCGGCCAAGGKMSGCSYGSPGGGECLPLGASTSHWAGPAGRSSTYRATGEKLGAYPVFQLEPPLPPGDWRVGPGQVTVVPRQPMPLGRVVTSAPVRDFDLAVHGDQLGVGWVEATDAGLRLRFAVERDGGLADVPLGFDGGAWGQVLVSSAPDGWFVSTGTQLGAVREGGVEWHTLPGAVTSLVPAADGGTFVTWAPADLSQPGLGAGQLSPSGALASTLSTPGLSVLAVAARLGGALVLATDARSSHLLGFDASGARRSDHVFRTPLSGLVSLARGPVALPQAGGMLPLDEEGLPLASPRPGFFGYAAWLYPEVPGKRLGTVYLPDSRAALPWGDGLLEAETTSFGLQLRRVELDGASSLAPLAAMPARAPQMPFTARARFARRSSGEAWAAWTFGAGLSLAALAVPPPAAPVAGDVCHVDPLMNLACTTESARQTLASWEALAHQTTPPVRCRDEEADAGTCLAVVTQAPAKLLDAALSGEHLGVAWFDQALRFAVASPVEPPPAPVCLAHPDVGALAVAGVKGGWVVVFATAVGVELLPLDAAGHAGPKSVVLPLASQPRLVPEEQGRAVLSYVDEHQLTHVVTVEPDGSLHGDVTVGDAAEVLGLASGARGLLRVTGAKAGLTVALKGARAKVGLPGEGPVFRTAAWVGKELWVVAAEPQGAKRAVLRRFSESGAPRGEPLFITTEQLNAVGLSGWDPFFLTQGARAFGRKGELVLGLQYGVLGVGAKGVAAKPPWYFTGIAALPFPGPGDTVDVLRFHPSYSGWALSRVAFPP